MENTVDRKNVKIILIVIILITVALFYYNFIIIKQIEYQYGTVEKTLYNPMMGFAPAADYIEAVGENTLVYVDITWREWEPEEGVYDIDSVIKDNNLEKWRQLGKKVVVRFVCDIPDEEAHLDIPDWLYDKTGDGTNYDIDYGKGYSPNYSNQIFIEAHEKAIKELGNRFGQDSFVCFVELGSLGHWGEWHVKYDEGILPIPSEEICRKYVEPYVESFPNARILMRRPFEMVKTYEMGVYNDMTGHEEDTLIWLDWIKNGGIYDEAEEPLILASIPNIWESSPVGGEFTSSFSMDEMLTWEINRTLGLLQKSHMTFIGPKSPIANKEMIDYPEETAQILKNIGYRYGIRNCKIKYNTWTGKTNLELLFENRGVAPMYFNWPVFIYLLDAEENIISKIPVKIDLTTLYQNKLQKVSINFSNEKSEKDVVVVGIGIENPETEKPEISLDMNSQEVNRIYLLYPY